MSASLTDTSAARLKVAFAPAVLAAAMFPRIASGRDIVGWTIVVLTFLAWWLSGAAAAEVAARGGMSDETHRGLRVARAVPVLNLLALGYLLWRGASLLPAAHDIEQADGRDTADARRRPSQSARERAAPAPAPRARAAATARPATSANPLEGILPAIKMVGMQPGEGAFAVEVDGGEHHGRKLQGDTTPVIQVTPDGFGVVYLVDRGDRYQWLTRGELADWGRNEQQAHAVAMRNLARLAPRMRYARQPGSYTGLLLNGNHEASLMLLDELWDREIAPQTPNGAVVSIAARDVCAFCDAADAAALQGLRKLGPKLRSAGTPASQLITDRLFVRRKGRWQLLDA
jgi:hypothetical protein